MAPQKPAPGTVLSTQKDDPRVQPGQVLSTDPNDPRLNIAPMINFMGRPMEKDTAKQVVDIGVPTVTSMLGGTFGAARGGPRGAMAGSAVGGAAGEGLAMAMYPGLGIPLPPASEAATRMAIGGATGAGGEAAAQGVFKLGGKVLRGASRRITPAARAVAARLQTPIAYSPVTEGIRTAMRAVPGPTRWAADTFFPATAPMVTPGQIPGTSFTRVAENIMEGSFMGSGAPRRIKDAQQMQLRGQAQALQGPFQPDDALGYMLQQNLRQGVNGLTEGVDTIPLDPATIGRAVQQGLAMNKDAWFKYAGKQFDKARELGLPDIPMGPLKEYAETLLESKFAQEAMGKMFPTLQRIARAGDTAVDPRLVPYEGDPKMQALIAKQLGIDLTPTPAELDHQSASDLASHLKAVIREDPNNEKMRGAAEQLSARLESEMERIGKELSPEAQHYYRLGRDLWRGGHEQFRTKFLETVADQYPSVLGKQLLRQPPEVLDEVLRAVPKGERGMLEQAALKEIFGKAPSAKDVDAIVKEFGEARLSKLLGFDARRKLKEYQVELVTEEADRLIGMLAQDPSVFAQSIRSRSIEDLRKMQQFLSEPSRQSLQQSTLQHVLESGDEDMASLAQIDDRLRQLTPARLNALVGPEAQAALRTLRENLKVLQPNKDMRGRMFIQLTQSGAAISVLSGAVPGIETNPAKLVSAGAILLGPAALAKILMSPAGRNWLIQGVKSPPGSKMATRAASELAAFMARSGLSGDQTPLTPETKVQIGGGTLPLPPRGGQ